MSGRGIAGLAGQKRRDNEIAIILGETGGVQADKRLVAYYAQTKLQPQHIRHLLAFRKHLTAVCLRKRNGGRATRRQLAQDMGMNRSTLGRKLGQLLAVWPGPNGPDYWEDGDEFVIDAFDRAFWAPHHRRQEKKRATWRAQARRQRRTLCASTPLESAERRSETPLSEMSAELIYAGSKKLPPHPPPPVVPTTRAPEPAAGPDGWVVEKIEGELFAGLEGLGPRAWLDAVTERESQAKQEQSLGLISQESGDELADVAWWRRHHAARLPDFDPRFLATAKLSRRYLTASVAVVLKTPKKTTRHRGCRVLRLAQAMQSNKFLTPFAVTSSKVLGTRYESGPYPTR